MKRVDVSLTSSPEFSEINLLGMREHLVAENHDQCQCCGHADGQRLTIIVVIQLIITLLVSVLM